MKTLAVKYRPQTFADVTEQESIKVILQQQLKSGDVKNAYLFTGGAGTGKTTCARIFANEINKGEGNPIEMDAASNSGVDDVRNIIQQAKTKSLDSEYKVFIIDECHSISNTGWQAFLKLIEEPPAKSIFIFCTTNPERVPKTILSRVQRYDFHRISQSGIVERLQHICQCELDESEEHNWMIVEEEALEYIAKIADGGMRDAITMMDKCLAYSTELMLENVVKALGMFDYDTYFHLTDAVMRNDPKAVVMIIEGLHCGGKDLKQFTREYCKFIIDLNKYASGASWQYISIPQTHHYETEMKTYAADHSDCLYDLLETVVELDSKMRYSTSPHYDIEASILLMLGKESLNGRTE